MSDPSLAAKTLFTIHSDDQFMEFRENEQFISDSGTVYPDDEIDLRTSKEPHHLNPSACLRITTDCVPKNPQRGFVFGSSPIESDILLTREGMHTDQSSRFALAISSDPRMFTIQNQCEKGTTIGLNGEYQDQVVSHHRLREGGLADVHVGHAIVRIRCPGHDTHREAFSQSLEAYCTNFQRPTSVSYPYSQEFSQTSNQSPGVIWRPAEDTIANEYSQSQETVGLSQKRPEEVVPDANGYHVMVRGTPVVFRAAQQEWDLFSILRASELTQIRRKFFRKKLARLNRVKRDRVDGVHRAWISLRDGILLIRAVDLETELAGLLALLPQTVHEEDENFLLRYQRGPRQNHIAFEGHEISYDLARGTVKATDLIKLANGSRRELFTYFKRHPEVKKDVVRGGAYSGTYILLENVPELLRSFKINEEVFRRLQERLDTEGYNDPAPEHDTRSPMPRPDMRVEATARRGIMEQNQDATVLASIQSNTRSLSWGSSKSGSDYGLSHGQKSAADSLGSCSMKSVSWSDLPSRPSRKNSRVGNNSRASSLSREFSRSFYNMLPSFICEEDVVRDVYE